MSVNGINVTPSALLAGLFPPDVVAYECHAPFEPVALHPQEAQCVASAVPKRRGEFAAGRACARAALAELQIQDFPLRMGAEREPLWPEGIVGSITHSGTFCGAALARSTRLMSLGLDVEERSALRPDLWRAVSTAEELAWLQGLPESQARTMAALIFSAKESFFKCQFPLTRQWLGFAHVNVRVEDDRFAVRPCRSLALESLAPPPWSGRFALHSALIATGVALERQPHGSAHRTDRAVRGSNRTVRGNLVDAHAAAP
jgi:4'-phosphopantetheinyl transferase EntD